MHMQALIYAKIGEYISSSEFLANTLDLSYDSAIIWMQVLIGLIFQLWVSQVFVALQLSKISENNNQWVIDSIGHFCEDGRDLAVNSKKLRICDSRVMQEYVIPALEDIHMYHLKLIEELSTALEYMYEFMSKPEDYMSNMVVMEREYRENIDIKRQLRLTL